MTDIAEFIEQIKFRLGNTKISIEIESENEWLYVIKDALKDIQPYLQIRNSQTLEFEGNCIELPSDVYDIKSVQSLSKNSKSFLVTSEDFKNTSSDTYIEKLRLYGQTYLYGLPSYYNRNFGKESKFMSNNIILSSLESQLYAQQKGDISTVIAYVVVDNFLYALDILDSSNQLFTIEYIQKLNTDNFLTLLEKDAVWYRYMKDLVLAHARIILGEIRSKVNVSNNPWVQNGEDILTRGIKEREEIILKIENTMDTFVIG